MSEVTVACVWVQANVPFNATYVTRLHSMVRRWLPRPFRFVCLTDRMHALPSEIETIPVSWSKDLKGWWAKVHLFKPQRFFGRVLYLDLDTLIVGALDPVVDFPASFALVPDAGTFQGKDGLAVVKRFNSSVMVWDAGVNADIYEHWTPAVTQRLWGDQDLIGEVHPEAATMPLEWFPRLSECPDGPKSGAKVLLAKKPKNEIAARQYRWFAEAWV
jgi:hypothetical protein